MRVLIAGAGAAGLSLATMLAESDRPYDITVIERGRPEERPGFGITVREEALSFLGLAEMVPGTHLSGRAFWLAGEVALDLPNPPSTHLICFSREAFISALTERCVRGGVRLTYDCDAATLSPAELRGYDLVVAADGADSAIRRQFQAEFKPQTEFGRNRYGWFGTDMPLHKLTVMLPASNAALAWGYKYSETASTFIVECTDSQFDDADLGGLSAEDTAREITRMFSAELGGAQVSCGDSVRWRRFGTVTNAALWHDNVVLIGDAAHTTHFSQGIGTMFAFDDALALHSSLEAHGEVAAALEAYESEQTPKITEFQQTAVASMQWAEDLAESAERDDQARVHELIDLRWPENSVPPGPLNSGDRA